MSSPLQHELEQANKKTRNNKNHSRADAIHDLIACSTFSVLSKPQWCPQWDSFWGMR